jgi:hypothetical protein
MLSLIRIYIYIYIERERDRDREIEIETLTSSPWWRGTPKLMESIYLSFGARPYQACNYERYVVAQLMCDPCWALMSKMFVGCTVVLSW